MDTKKKQSKATPKKNAKPQTPTEKPQPPRKPQDLTPISELKKPKKAPLKQVFDSPFTFKWPRISDEDQTFVIDQLRAHFPVPDSPLIKFVKPKDILVGINEVTKNLERNNVRLVIIFKDAPTSIISHIPQMCHLKSVPLIPLTKEISLPISTVALGFKKSLSDPQLESLVNLLITKAPALSINWLTPLAPADKETIEKDSAQEDALRAAFLEKETETKETGPPPKSKRAMKRERKAAAEATTSTTTATEPMEVEEVPTPVEEAPKEEPAIVDEPVPKKAKQVFAKKYEKVPRLLPIKMKKLQPKRTQ